MLDRESPRVTQRKNRSFADQKLEILAPVRLHESIPVAQRIEETQDIIFIHPPKTGGTNLAFVAEALSKKFPAFQAKRFAVPRIVNQSPGVIQENWQGGLKTAWEALEQDSNCCDPLKFISGHFPYGLHTKISKRVCYVALIRDPIERAISGANFDFQRGYIDKEKVLTYLLESDIDNPQTRMLAGVAHMQGECNENTFSVAKKNIETNFLLLGVTEETNLFIQILASIQGWGPLALVRSQVTGDKVITELDEKIITRLKEKHKFDCLLYDFAKKGWAEWKKKYVISDLPLTNEKIMCIPAEFSNTRQPLFLTKTEIEEYNSKVTSDLVEVSQKHSGVKDHPPSKNSKLMSYGLGLAAVIGVGFFTYSLLKGSPDISNNVNALKQ